MELAFSEILLEGAHRRLREILTEVEPDAPGIVLLDVRCEGRGGGEHGDIDDEHVDVRWGEARLGEELVECDMEGAIHISRTCHLRGPLHYILRAVDLLARRCPSRR